MRKERPPARIVLTGRDRREQAVGVERLEHEGADLLVERLGRVHRLVVERRLLGLPAVERRMIRRAACSERIRGAPVASVARWMPSFAAASHPPGSP